MFSEPAYGLPNVTGKRKASRILSRILMRISSCGGLNFGININKVHDDKRADMFAACLAATQGENFSSWHRKSEADRQPR